MLLPMRQLQRSRQQLRHRPPQHPVKPTITDMVSYEFYDLISLIDLIYNEAEMAI